VDLRLETEVLRLSLRDPFRIARPEASDTSTTMIVRLHSGEQDGLGEAYPVAYYGETVETLRAVLPLLVSRLATLPEPPTERRAAMAWLQASASALAAAIGGHGAAKSGLDVALHDLVGRRLGLTLHDLLETPARIPPTDFSLGLDEPEVVAERARRAARFPALKVKVGGAADLPTLEAVRSVYDGPIRVDANTGWQAEQAAALIPELERLGVELIEQPFPARDLPRLRWLQERSRLPLVADESALTEGDLTALVDVVGGVNVKLAKCGGVGPALRMIRRARELGLRVMVGCMVETSLGVAAAAAIAGLADWVDLDGNLLLADDPFGGLELDPGCVWRLPTRPGVGVMRRSAEAGPGSGGSVAGRVDKVVDKLVDDPATP
jgi:L-alanine-DL-glutamate epimerase-like enolase superfamily enzyme